jgi:cyanophycinase
MRAACLPLILAALLASAAPPVGATRGVLFIVGGGPQPASLVRRFVELAGGPGRARIIVLAQASADSTSGPEKAAELRALGADARDLPITRAQADDEAAVRDLATATGIWFCGGDQVRLTAAIRGTRVDSAIHARYQAGAVIGGTSAGAAVMSTPMITGDERHRGGARPPADSADAFLTIARDDIVTAPGFGFLPDAIVDQHFLRRRRHNRLISLVLAGPQHLGVGIDESTALIVWPDGHWEIAGESAAVVYDARHAVTTDSAAAVLGASGVVMHVLPPGSRFDPATGRAVLGAVGPGAAAR